MAYNVKFLKGTAEAYAAISVKDENTFYYTSDDGQLYLGTIKLSNAGDLSNALTRIGTNETNIGTLQTAVDLLNEANDTKSGTIAKMIKDALTTYDAQFADVATSGDAADVSIDDDDSLFTATNVEDALAELKGDISDLDSESTITVVGDAANPTEGYLKSYRIYQGGSDPSNLVGTIDIPKDLVVTSGEIVENPQGQTAGTYLKLTIANQTEPIYINVADLVDTYTAAANASQIQLAINSNTISAEIVNGSVDADALGSNAVTTVKIANGNVTKEKLESDVQTSLDKADTAVQSVVEGDSNGQIKVDGTAVNVHGLGSAAYMASTAFDAAGAAAAVLGSTADSSADNTVYGVKALANSAKSIAESATSSIAALDVTDTAVAGSYVSAVSQTDGLISVTRTALPDYSTTYDAYGAAATAESNANTYTDNALTWGSFPAST